MSTANQNIEMFAGEDRTVDFTVTDDSGPLNLTGATLAWTMFGRGVDLDKTPTVQGDPTAGVVRLILDAADTATIQPGTYYHQLTVTDSAGDIAYVTTGVVTLKGAA